MNKRVIKDKRTGESYLRLEHPTGLTILLYPMKGFLTSYALFGTRYGSVDNEWRTGDEEGFTRVPDGVAHYLEHKLFESEDGDAFTLFAKTGAEANAYTSFDKTCYLFSCTDRFGESLTNLLRFVQAPYFTEETVRKEQGIIGQEIKMYEDSPNWRVMFNLLNALYVNNPVKLDIAGTVESISKITPEILYRCYNTFYNLSNMVLTISGNFDPEEAVRIIEAECKPSEPLKIERKTFEEPLEAAQTSIEQRLDVSEPLFYFGYKIRPLKEPMALLKQQIVLDLLLDLLAGPTSAFYEEMNRKGLLNATFDTEVFGERGSLAALFGGESKNPQGVFDAFTALVDRCKAEGFSEEEFLSCKNAMYGRTIKGLNDVEGVASELLSYEMMGVELFSVADVIASVELSDLTQALHEYFGAESRAISVILPLEGE